MTFSAYVPPEKRVPMANAARGLPQLAHLVFPAMERAAWPGSGFHSGASNRLARPDKAGRKEQTSFCIVDSQSVKNTDTAGHKGYDAGKKVSSVTSRWTRKDCPMGYT